MAFWLLAGAWLCANVRPGTIGAVLDWCEESARFSHQQRLTLQVATLLGEPAAVSTVAKAENEPQPEPRVPAPPASGTKKLEAPLGREVAVAGVASLKIGYIGTAEGMAGRGRAAPPHGPPRATRLS